MHAILEAVFPSRVKAVRALLAPSSLQAVANIAEAEEAVKTAILHVHDEAGQADWRSLLEVLSIAIKLRKWHLAVRHGEADADRYLRAARLQRSEWLTAEGSYGEELKSILDSIDGDFVPKDVGFLLERLAGIPFPVKIFTEDPPRSAHWRTKEADAGPELAVAFLEFNINGQQAAAIHRLAANQLHDLELTLRVSHWPDKADKLFIKPVSVEPEDLWDLPEFTFNRPSGEMPFTFQAHGRLLIKVPMALDARPLEFIYAAEFFPGSAEQPVAVAGHRSLRLDSSDTSNHLETGYPSLDQRLIELRNILRNGPRIPERDISITMRLAKPLANLVGQAVQDNSFPVPINEATLEKRVIEHLRSRPEIGVELEIQAHSGGGRTDLSYRQTRIELKISNERPLKKEDLKRFANQAAAYAVSSDKAVAILCVLDGSVKKGPPLPVNEMIQVIPVQPGDRPIYVVAFVLQGNLARPSDLSR